MTSVALLMTALLFGGMVLYSFGFAAFVFTALPADTAGPLIRRAFPKFYSFVLGVSGLTACLLVFSDPIAALALGLIAITTISARQILMPAINAATDAGETARFKRLHGLSAAITLAHITAAAWIILRLAG